jgi:hypothetical protein
MTLSPANSVGNGLPLGLAGAVAATRYVGATTSGAPASGTFAVGDLVVAQDGALYVCTVAGSPGTWVAVAGGGGVTVLDYTEFTAPVTINSTNPAVPVTVVTAGAVAGDGSTLTCVQFYAPAVASASGGQVILQLFDGSTDLGRLAQVGASIGSGSPRFEVLTRRYLTPSSGSHTYSVRGYETGGNGTVSAGAGGTDTFMPGYIRVTTGS